MTDTTGTKPENFNAFSDPWIPVLNDEGTVVDVSIRNALVYAHTYRGLASELAPTDAAIMRILISTLHRALLPTLGMEPSINDRLEAFEALWQSPELPADLIDSYVNEWHHRGFLFDAELPFLQTPHLESTSGSTRGPGLLRLDVSKAPALYTQSPNEEPLSFAQALQSLVTISQWDYSGIKTAAVGDPRVKGGRGYPRGRGILGWCGVTVLTGNTLRDTLLLNLPWGAPPSPEDKPLWEQPSLPSGPRDAQDIFDGPIALMTWPQRRIRLFAEGSQVTQCLVCNGDELDYTHLQGRETMTPFRYSVTQSRNFRENIYMPRTLPEDQAMWRGFQSLAPTKNVVMVESVVDKQPLPDSVSAANVSWLAKLQEEGLIPNDYVVGLDMTSAVYGSQAASVTHILHDYLPLHASVLTAKSVPANDLIVHAIQMAEQVGKAIWSFNHDILAASRNIPSPKAKDERKAFLKQVSRASEQFFAELDMPMRAWIFSLSNDTDIPTARKAIIKCLRNTAFACREDLLRNVPPSAWTSRREAPTIGRADQRFRSTMHSILDDATATTRTDSNS